MVYVACVCVVCLSALAGNFFAKVFVWRDEFYKELSGLLLQIKNNYYYKNLTISNVTNEYINSGVKNKKFFNYLLKLTSGNLEAGEQKIPYLKKQELNSIVRFFSEVGCGNSEVEINNVENFIEEIKQKSSECQSQRKANEKLIYKISLAVGVAICILII